MIKTGDILYNELRGNMVVFGIDENKKDFQVKIIILNTMRIGCIGKLYAERFKILKYGVTLSYERVSIYRKHHLFK